MTGQGNRGWSGPTLKTIIERNNLTDPPYTGKSLQLNTVVKECHQKVKENCKESKCTLPTLFT